MKKIFVVLAFSFFTFVLGTCFADGLDDFKQEDSGLLVEDYMKNNPDVAKKLSRPAIGVLAMFAGTKEGHELYKKVEGKIQEYNEENPLGILCGLFCFKQILLESL